MSKQIGFQYHKSCEVDIIPFNKVDGASTEARVGEGMPKFPQPEEAPDQRVPLRAEKAESGQLMSRPMWQGVGQHPLILNLHETDQKHWNSRDLVYHF